MQGKRAPDLGEANVTRGVTNQLREQILASPEGLFLGSETELLVRFGISRPTFRQVARVLEQEELLLVRRGIGGGYYSRHPSIGSVGNVCANFLRSHQVKIRDIYEVLLPLSDIMVRRAAECEDATLRLRMVDLRGRFIALLDRQPDQQVFLDLDREAGALTAEMAGNPLIWMQISILYHLARERMAREQQLPSHEDVDRFTRLRIRLQDAILAGEPDIAAAVAKTLISTVQNADAPISERDL